ncbi:TIGR00645 family protein [Inmirania thermothiophila]|uniref:UPF0114 protein EDC57_2490 n=1 Tax=Inmirania thermothiophila TaxID=1750597 RepID=A0A3N1XX72_9GAMM|nr:TIGR00645 family protein [Inmirania thermothiophila]ROR29812.1 uncharacterized protein (TIGR00645 family) [Inmirania thermothiophila]
MSAERVLEQWLFRTRWLLAPFFVGLVLAILALLAKFLKGLVGLAPVLAGGDGAALILAVLDLVDVTLLAGLLLIIVFSGYENFVSKFDIGEHADRPAWMGKVGFSDLKIKVMGSIVAISAIELLKAFINADALSHAQLAWRVGIHLTFVVSGVLFAVTDRIAEGKGGH